jgi:flavin-binding protein dodecin
VVHVGDIMAGGGTNCADGIYADRKRRFDASRHPFVLTPGDNDWTDCRRESNGRRDPLERLAKVREVFFADAFSLGRTRMPLAVQEACAEQARTGCTCPALPENRLWTMGKVVFATIHVVGSNDNRGFDAANDAEQRCREAANLAWLERAFRLAATEGMRGLVIATQMNPVADYAGKVYDPLKARLAAEAKRLARPVLFVHGESHTYRFDRPFRDEAGSRVGNIRRLETFGSPQVGWVRVTVDPNDADLFRADPHGPSTQP